MVNGSGYDERKNLRHNRYFHCERSCSHEQKTSGDIGFRGRRRKDFLREHRPVTFNQLVLSGELFKYLALFNQEATERLESIIQAMKVAQGITEEIKGRDQMAWVGAMNNIRACAEEIVYAELVYA